MQVGPTLRKRNKHTHTHTHRSNRKSFYLMIPYTFLSKYQLSLWKRLALFPGRR